MTTLIPDSSLMLLDCVSGSHAYGTNIEGSDIDRRGIFIMDNDEYLSGKRIDQVSDKTNDITYYEIERFLKLAAQGNPNIIELMHMPSSSITFSSIYWDDIMTDEVKDKFITKRLVDSFGGYAISQIKKAKGLNKKINMDKTKVNRKSVLDFCYVLTGKESAKPFRKFIETVNSCPVDTKCSQKDYGLAKVNNAPDLYSMYLMETNGGIIADNSNDVQTRSIPIDAKFVSYLRFDKNAYSTHCKDYREYVEWIKNRNPQRYADNLKGEQGYDHKNMMHCVRLLETALDIATTGKVLVKRPNRKYLLKIRMGEEKYEDLLAHAESLLTEVNVLFKYSNLPEGVPMDFVHSLILKFRKNA